MSSRKPSSRSSRGRGAGAGAGASSRSLRKPMSRKLAHADTQQLNINSSAIAGIIDNLRGQLSVLEKDIKADKAGQKEYRIQLGKLEKRKEDAKARLKKNYAFAEQFDRDIGPFERKYHALTKDIHALYDNAKQEHLKGIDLLIEAFSYHPLFKRHDDTFTAVPFKPA